MLYYFCSILVVLNSVVQSTISVLDKGILPIVENSVALQFFIDVENESRRSSCQVSSGCAKCCVANQIGEDCKAMEAYGINYELILPRDRTSLLFVYPTVQQYNLIGHCDFYIDCKCGLKNRTEKKLSVNIPFDTRFYRNLFNVNTQLIKAYRMVIPKHCSSIDQDPLNKCLPVNCDWTYNGNRPYFDSKRNLCTEAPYCVSDTLTDDDPDVDLPGAAYVPTSNVCRDLRKPLTQEDIYALTNRAIFVVARDTKNTSKSGRLDTLLRYFKHSSISRFEDNCSTHWSTSILHTSATVVLVLAVVMGACCCFRTLVGLLPVSKRGIKRRFKRLKKAIRRRRETTRLKANEHTDALLKEVICKDLPEEYWDDLKLCDRIRKNVKRKKRYRMADLGSQVSLDAKRAEIAKCDPLMSSSEDEVQDR